MTAKLLLIEDEGPLRENMAELLRLKGYQVVTATDGQQGVLAAIRENPDLVVCDITMPRQDGYAVLDAIRQHPLLASTPFIFLTARAQPDDLRQGMNRGADDYLTKPFAGHELTAAIESRLRREQLRPNSAQPPTPYLTTLRGRDKQGYMTLHTDDCLLFFMQDNAHCVLHPLGTFQIEMTFEELTAQLDPVQFFRANRRAIVHRKTVQKYAYWEKGKYCVYLTANSQLRQVVLPRARFSPFKHWLSVALPAAPAG